ncbi:V-type ATP synthase subunit K [Candidatus Rubidus massiliensis]|nr:MAG: V-type ATP synthase subunit K [Chlamydia sp. 32-24]CDZ80322.1 V-type ATP synthase subunit K [Candidatus Rubidus massiliensis]
MDLSFNMAGPILALGLSLIGSSIGLYIAGAASHAAMSRVDEGHGKFIGMSAAPSSQAIYGFLEMLLLANAINEGRVSPISGVVIGVAVGSAIMLSSIYQGMVCATGIQASMKQPAIFGKCFAAVGLIESISLFAFVFSLLIM